MAETIVELLTDVADAIREKKGSNEPINAQNFAEEIKNLPSGGSEVNAYGEEMVDNTGLGIRGITNLVVNAETIVGYAYIYGNLTTVHISEGCKAIGDNAFQYNKALNHITLPSTLESIGSGAFRETGLISLTIPPSVSKISSYCFGLSYNLSQLRIQGILQTIPTYAMHSCDSLVTLILEGAEITPLANVNAFGKTPMTNGTGFIYVPDDLVEAYKGATNWSTFASQIKGLSELPQE